MEASREEQRGCQTLKGPQKGKGKSHLAEGRISGKGKPGNYSKNNMNLETVNIKNATKKMISNVSDYSIQFNFLLVAINFAYSVQNILPHRNC